MAVLLLIVIAAMGFGLLMLLSGLRARRDLPEDRRHHHGFGRIALGIVALATPFLCVIGWVLYQLVMGIGALGTV